MISRKILYGFIFILLLPTGIKATHIVGGELYYLYLGNNKYEIRLTVYRDCWNGIPEYDDPAAIGIFDSANNFVDSIMMKFRGKTPIPPVIDDPCIIPPANICYEVTTYIDTVTLPPLQGGYQLAYQRCCRNYTILNIIRPDTTGATYYAAIPSPSVVSVNSNPRFNKLPPSFACANKPFIFDHSATDDQGDSLVYSICDPLVGARFVGDYDCVPQPCGVRPQPPFNPPYQSVNWKLPNYGLSNVFGGVPLTVDPQTGMLYAVPNTIGQFVYGVCVKEYRNGVFVTETRRDYQLNILPCQSSVSARVDTTVSCGNNTVNFKNNSSGATTYYWNFGDPTTQSDTSLLANPTYTYPDTGTYYLQMIAVGPNKDCADTVNTVVRVLPAFNTSFTSSITPCTYRASFTSAASMNNTGIPKTWTWTFGDGFSSGLKNPVHNYATKGPHSIQLITKTHLGCVDTVTNTVSFTDIPTVYVGADKIICSGDSVKIGNTSNASYTYLWSPSISPHKDTIPFPYVNPVISNYYTLTVTDTNSCKASDSVYVDVAFSTLNLKDTFNICYGSEIAINPGGNTNYIYNWSPAAGLDNVNAANPKAAPVSNTLYSSMIKTKSTSGDTCFIYKTVQVNVSVDTIQLNAGNDTTVCRDALLKPAINGLYSEVIWSTSNAFTDTLNTNGETNITVIPQSNPMVYYIKSSNAYCSVKDSVIVYTNKANLNPGPNLIMCLGDTLALEVNNLNPTDILSYRWSPESDIISGENTANPLVSPTASTTYQVLGINQYLCRDSGIVNVSVNMLNTNVNVYSDEDTIYIGESTKLHVENAVGSKFIWSPSDGLNNVNAENPIATPKQTTTYQVKVIDANGCITYSQLRIYVKALPVCGEPDIFVPNAFTPNGDNMNDKLYVRGNRIDELYFAVFDRWGEKVFETNSQSTGWDGTYKGEKASPAVFTYYLKAKCIGGNEYFKKGNVTLLK